MADTPSSDLGNKLIPPNANFAGKAHCASLAQYDKMYKRSIEDPDAFWAEIADTFVWQKKWDKVHDYSFEGNVFIKWFINGKTNISVNALDRHLEKRGDQVAIIWEGNSPEEHTKLTYRQLHTEVCKFANVLKSLGREEGGSRLFVHADDSRAAHGDAGVRSHRRHSFGRVRGVQRGFAARPSSGFGVQDRDHAGHGLARQQERHRDEDEGRHGRRPMSERQEHRGREADRLGRSDAGGPRRVVARSHGQSGRQV